MATKFPSSTALEEILLRILENQIGCFPAIPLTCNDLPEIKGIYFWYISAVGLNIIMERLGVPSTRLHSDNIINGKILIYLGTAGTRKTDNNAGHIKQRLEWHIKTKHRESAIKNGTLSTFRTSLGAVLCDDLIAHEGVITEEVLNKFMEEHLSISYICYDGGFKDVMNSIDEDEKFLIGNLRPLFNLKNNLNKKILGHPTNLIRLRRREINKATKDRI